MVAAVNAGDAAGVVGRRDLDEIGAEEIVALEIAERVDIEGETGGAAADRRFLAIALLPSHGLASSTFSSSRIVCNDPHGGWIKPVARVVYLRAV
jgi:hypothetical protein